jgi:hypothetical protein
MTQNHTKNGWIKGEPFRYLRGHWRHGSGQRWKLTDPTVLTYRSGDTVPHRETDWAWKLPIFRRADGTVRAFALVDEADHEWAAHYFWAIVGKGYVVRSLVRCGVRTSVGLAREVLGLEFGDPTQANHVNLDKLDNRLSNLELNTNAQNGQLRAGAYAGS